MKYKYIGRECVFACPGDIFEPTFGGNNYVTFMDDSDREERVSIPAWVVESSEDFEALDSDELVENLKVCLEDMLEDDLSKDEKKAFKYVLNWIEERT